MIKDFHTPYLLFIYVTTKNMRQVQQLGAELVNIGRVNKEKINVALKKRKGSFFDIPAKGKKRIKNKQCPICGKPKSEWTRRTDWTCCSKECTKVYSSYYKSWPEVRREALHRDKYTCVQCGHKPERERVNVNYVWSKKKLTEFINSEEGVVTSWYCKLSDRKNYAMVWKSSELIGDHIVPIALGGKEFDINNVQTLCTKCNKEKTAQDAKDIAKARRSKKRGKKK